jgi:DNA-directed RNA polymerase specialized sigma24 family protein
MENLTEKVLQYQKTRSGLAEIMNALAQRIYQFPRRKMGWDEDACGEFYLFFHPRLVRLLDRFRDQGKPFESYLCAVLTWQLRNFARDRRRLERSWNATLRIEPGPACTLPDFPPVEVPRTPPLGDPRKLAPLIRSDADRRNLLFLVLKCARTLDPSRVSPLAALCGVTTDRLSDLAAELCRLRAPREERLETLRVRRNRAFAQSRLLEAELLLESDPFRRAELTHRLARIRKRTKLAMARMARVGLAPTNREISAALHVPKGTVDSGLFWLKRKLSAAYDPQNLKSA